MNFLAQADTPNQQKCSLPCRDGDLWTCGKEKTTCKDEVEDWELHVYCPYIRTHSVKMG